MIRTRFRTVTGMSTERSRGSPFARYLIYAGLGGFVLFGMLTAVVLTERNPQPGNVTTVVIGDAGLAALWAVALWRVGRRGHFLGMTAAMWWFGPPLAFLAAAAGGFFLLR